MMSKKIAHLYFVTTVLAASLIFSSCTSKKRSLRTAHQSSSNEKPSRRLADKYADIMNVSPSAIKNGKLYEFIDDWEGTKYSYGGLSKRGIDCSGLVYLAYQQVYGMTIPRSTGQQVKIIKRKYEGQLKEGDLVFFNYDGKRFSHVGLYLQNGYYVHASTSHGVMIDRLHNPYTYQYFSRCGSIKGK